MFMSLLTHFAATGEERSKVSAKYLAASKLYSLCRKTFPIRFWPELRQGRKIQKLRHLFCA
jgi:hypothetical protein